MEKFDGALASFTQACERAAKWKDYYGAAYRTRLDYAFADVKQAYEAACRVDEEERNQGEY